MKIKKTTIFFIITTLFIVIFFTIGIVCIEMLLRKKGYPWKRLDFGNQPIKFEHDSILGWKNKPGNYIMWDGRVKVTIWQDGSRATSPKRIKRNKQILFIGGSYTEGWAISDSDTFAWKLQKKFPSIEFLNYGAGGYGTYQSLLVLERILSKSPSPMLVFYGFCGGHDIRNVAEFSWIKSLLICSKRGLISLPYCTLDPGGNLVKHPPETFPMWPLRESSGIVSFLEEKYAKLKMRKRPKQKKLVTEKLLLEMNALCREKNTRLIILTFHYYSKSDQEKYEKIFEKNNLKFIDCTHPGITGVPYDGHPDGKTNDFWASYIEEFLRNEIH